MKLHASFQTLMDTIQANGRLQNEWRQVEEQVAVLEKEELVEERWRRIAQDLVAMKRENQRLTGQQ